MLTLFINIYFQPHLFQIKREMYCPLNRNSESPDAANTRNFPVMKISCFTVVKMILKRFLPENHLNEYLTGFHLIVKTHIAHFEQTVSI